MKANANSELSTIFRLLTLSLANITLQAMEFVGDISDDDALEPPIIEDYHEKIQKLVESCLDTAQLMGQAISTLKPARDIIAKFKEQLLREEKTQIMSEDTPAPHSNKIG